MRATHLAILFFVGSIGCSSGDASPSSTEEDGADASSEDSSTIIEDSAEPEDSSTPDTAPADTGPSCGASSAKCSDSSDCCSGLDCIGGACGTCPAAHPAYCKEDRGCWDKDIVCSSIKKCPDGSEHGCLYSESLHYDCASDRCLCPSDFPVWCGPSGSLPGECWSSGTDCTTRVSCSGVTKACGSGYAFDCASGTCKPTSTGGGGTTKCTYDSQCGSGKICRSGSRITPECTHNSDCGSCQRCSDYHCINCLVGPYGCTC